MLRKVCLVLLTLTLLSFGFFFPRIQIREATSQAANLLTSSTSSTNGLSGYSTQTLILYNNTLVSGTPKVTSASSPVAMVFDSSNSLLYVLDSGSDTLFAVDPISNIVTHTITLGLASAFNLLGLSNFALGYDPVNGYIYVANTPTGTVEIVDPHSNLIIANLSVAGFSPYEIIPDTINGNMYVLGEINASNSYPTSLYLLNGSTFETKIGVCTTSLSAELAFDPSNSNLYVPCPSLMIKNQISVIDTNLNRIMQNISFNSYSGSYYQGIVYDKTSNLLYFYYAPDSSSLQLLAIDPATNLIVANISGLSGYQLFLGGEDPKTGKLYIPEFSFSNSNISVLDTFSNSIVSNISLGPSFYATGEAFDPSNDFLYVSSAAGWIYGINTTSDAVASSIPLASHLGALALDTSNGDLFISTMGSSLNGNRTGFVMDGSTDTLLSGSFNAGYETTNMVYDSKNGNLYTGGFGSNNATVIDASTRGLVASINAGSSVSAAGCDPSTGLVYIGLSGSPTILPTILVINGTTIVKSIPINYSVSDIEYDPKNGFMYAAERTSSNSVINGTNIINTFTLITAPEGIAYDSLDGNLYVTYFGSANLSVISPSTGLTTEPGGVPIGNPSNPLYDPLNGFVYVADNSNGTIYALNGTKIVSSIATGSPGQYILAFNPQNGKLYAANQQDGTIIIISAPYSMSLSLWPFFVPAAFVVVAIGVIVAMAYLAIRDRNKAHRPSI